MSKLQIKIDLEHDETLGACLLDFQSVFNKGYLNEYDDKYLRLGMYLNKLCELYNYPILRNKNLRFDDGDYCRLQGWVNGYDYAIKHKIQELPGSVIIKGRWYEIRFDKPFMV